MASVEARANDWRVVWREGGRKLYELFDAADKAEQFKQLVEAYGNRTPPGWTFGQGDPRLEAQLSTLRFEEWARRSINSRATANDRTRADYLRDLDRHLVPVFGGLPLDLITREQVGTWLIEMRREHRPKTVKNVQALASSVMRDAVDHGYTSINPFRGALRALPRVKQEDVVFLTRPEFELLLRSAPEHYRPLVLALAHTGLRWSEATALRVRDVDLAAKRIRVTSAWKRTPENTYEVGEPKSRRSRRALVVSTRVVDAMRPLITGKHPGDFVFLTVNGLPVRHNNFSLRVWGPTITDLRRCKEHAEAAEPCMDCAGTLGKRPRIHDLRHSHASWLIADKVDLVAIQRRMGHESITVTIDLYGHLLPDVDEEVAAALEGWR